MSNDLSDINDAYSYTIQDMQASLSCPQCRAAKLIIDLKDTPGRYAVGQRLACMSVLMHSHECTQHLHEDSKGVLGVENKEENK